MNFSKPETRNLKQHEIHSPCPPSKGESIQGQPLTIKKKQEARDKTKVMSAEFGVMSLNLTLELELETRNLKPETIETINHKKNGTHHTD